jgi:SAM-dependent methyltransferase
VGPQGKVLGIDLSAIVLEAASRNAENSPHVCFVNGDAQVFPFEFGSFDAAYSRFGTMFFAEPVTAFNNIRKALKPKGRLAFVCWRSLEENELDTVPLKAAFPHLPDGLTDSSASAPFSFARREFVHHVLDKAGFRNIEISACDEEVGSGSLDSMLELTLRVGSLGRILRESPDLRNRVFNSLREMLAARDGVGGPMLNAAIWVVKAKSA